MGSRRGSWGVPGGDLGETWETLFRTCLGGRSWRPVSGVLEAGSGGPGGALGDTRETSFRTRLEGGSWRPVFGVPGGLFGDLYGTCSGTPENLVPDPFGRRFPEACSEPVPGQFRAWAGKPRKPRKPGSGPLENPLPAGCGKRIQFLSARIQFPVDFNVFFWSKTQLILFIFFFPYPQSQLILAYFPK